MILDPDSEPDRNPTGRVLGIEIDLDEFSRLAKLHPTLEEAAGFFRCSITVINRFLKKKEYAEAWEAGKADAKISTRRHLMLAMLPQMKEEKDPTDPEGKKTRRVAVYSGPNVQAASLLAKNLLNFSDKVDRNDTHTLKGMLRHVHDHRSIPDDKALQGMSDAELVQAMHESAGTVTRH